MPTIGDVKRACEIEERSDKSRAKYLFVACLDCGTGKWSPVIGERPTHPRCGSCASRISNTAIARRKPHITNAGYVKFTPLPTDSYRGMGGRSSQLFVHRYVMARHLGRWLESWEIVHHINGDKQNNRIENLELLSSHTQHLPSTLYQKEIIRLQKEILKWQKLVVWLLQLDKTPLER